MGVPHVSHVLSRRRFPMRLKIWPTILLLHALKNSRRRQSYTPYGMTPAIDVPLALNALRHPLSWLSTSE
eukprot:944951-Pyramimonas_sp.AAC.1